VVQRDQQQKQADAQQAVCAGKELTPDQLANLSPEARPAMESKERDHIARGTVTGAKDQKHQPGIVQTGKGKSGGRSR